MVKPSLYEITADDLVPPFKIAGNRTPRQFAAELIEAAQLHAGYGWAWQFKVAGYMLAFFAPPDEEWIKHFGEPGDPEPVDWNGFSRETADLMRYHMWKPLYHLPYNRRVEMKKRDGSSTIIETGSHARDHWEALGFAAWRDVRPEGDEIRLPISGQVKPKPGAFEAAISDLKKANADLREATNERAAKASKPPIFFNGENVRDWGKKPARPKIEEAPARARPRLALDGPDKPILEAQKPSKRPRLALEPPKPEKAPRPRLAPQRGLLDDED